MVTLIYGFAALLLMLCGWGVLSPMLVSAGSDIAVLVGFFVALIVVPGLLTFTFKGWAKTDEGRYVIRRIKDRVR